MPVNLSDETTDNEETIESVDNTDTLVGDITKTNSTWQFGTFEFTSDALRFVLIYMALMMVLAVGLYNLTVQQDMAVKALWAPIVSGSFFCMVPAPSIPRSSHSMFTPSVAMMSKQA